MAEVTIYTTQQINVTIGEDDVISVQVVSGNQESIQFQDEGADLGAAGTVQVINFTGSGVTASRAGSTLTVNVSGGSSGSGDVTGPASSVDSRMVEFDGTTGKLIKDGGVVVSTFIKTLLDDADAATSQATLGAVPTSRTVNGQALSANIIVPNSLYYTRTGKYTLNSLSGAALTTVALGANSLRAYQYPIVKSMTILEFISEVTTLAGSTTYRLGLYTDTGNSYPNALVSGTDVGTYDSGSNGVKSSGVVSIILAPALYWFAVNSNGAATVRAIPIGSMPQAHGADTLGTNAINTRWTAALTYGAMPPTFPAGATAAANAAAVAVGLLT